MLARPLLQSDSTAFSAGSGTLSYGSPTDITNDSKANALPSCCVLANGDWLLIYTKSDSLETTRAILVGKLSSDEGATFGDEFGIAEDAELSVFNPGICCLASGRVVIVFNLYDHTVPSTPADAVRTIYSDDPELGAAATYSAPYTVNAPFTGYCASGTSRPVVFPDQTVMITVYGDSGGFSSAMAFFSEDAGETFPTSATMADGPGDSRNYYEPSAALANGRLIADYRTTSGAGNMYQNESYDKGASWTAPAISHGGFSPSNLIQRVTRTLVAVVRGNADGDPHAFTSTNLGGSWVDQGAIEAVFEFLYGLWMDRSDGSGLIIYASQPGASLANLDIRSVEVTET